MRTAVRGNLYSVYKSSTITRAGARVSMTRCTAVCMASRRASRVSLAGVVITPDSTTLTPPGPSVRTPKPVAVTPGSTPMTVRGRAPGSLCQLFPNALLGRGDGVDDLVGDVVVGMDGLHVVLLLQGFDEPQDGGGVLALHTDRGLRHHVDLRLENRKSLAFE